MLAWSTHTEGAIQLVQNRGRDQLKTKVGRDIFVTVRTQQIIHSFSSGQPAARNIDFWIKDAVKDPFATDLQRITLQISELKTEANKLLVSVYHSPENVKIVMNVVRKCQIMDQELQQWSQNIPENYKGKPVTWVNGVSDGDYSKAEVFPGRIDAFQDLWVTTVWVTMRCSRLVLASLIVRAVAWVYSPIDYRTTPEYTTWSNICAGIITDLCAAIPYQLGWFKSRQELLERTDLTSYCCGDEAVAKGLSGYFVTWPLSCIITQDYSTAGQRAWAKGRLEYIASDLGVGYAKMLTHVNVRVPSMLIKRDAMAASGSVDTSAIDFEKVLSNRIVPPSRHTVESPAGPSRERVAILEQQQRAAMEAALATYYRFSDGGAH
ncbi:negative acting factor [Cordyceps javanica]|uniref:Negative acting factor n=1 Tax=Cordyceps javanica TaxID=43265 RepID=A0A545W696_9HYPO|nr:negative acting factor [Cordyceps javanica]TQW09510.1 negative acting factor [Cordyceps javanica]